MENYSKTRAFVIAAGLSAILATQGRAQSGTHGLLHYWAQDDRVVISEGDASISGPLAIPDEINGLPVVKIDDQAFNNRDGITSLNFPSSLKTIDYRAFYKCDGITRVDLPEGLESLGKDAFWQCNYVIDITIPASLTSLGEYALGNCNRLESITVDPANPAYADINGVLFSKDRNSLILYPERWEFSRQYAIPEGTKSINDRAFNGVGYLWGITLPDSVSHIGEYAFVGCVNWTNVLLPEAVTAIGYGAFMNCRKLPTIHIPKAVKHIGDKAFESCSLLSSITVDSSNTEFASYDGVLYSKDLTELICCPAGWQGRYIAPQNLKHIGYRAFYKCAGISEITLSDKVETLGDESFRNCYNLTNLHLSASLTTLGKQMFLGCRSLESIEVDPENPVFMDIDGVLFSKDGKILLAYPSGRAGAYTVPEGVEVVYDYAFNDCDQLTELILPEGVVDIARDAFKGCANLVSITMPGSVARIGRDVFDDSVNLDEITVSSAGSEFLSVDGVLFSQDGKRLIRYPQGRVGKYAVPAGTEVVEWHAFYKCSNLSGVSLPASVHTIGNNAFSSSYTLPSAIFLGDGPAQGASAFSGTGSGFTIYHLEGSAGFTTPVWNGYAADVLLPPSLAWNEGLLQWLGQTGIDYTIQSSTNLVSNEWNMVVEELVPGNGVTNYIQPDFIAEHEVFKVEIDLP